MAELATRQHGVVARRQLVELGLGKGAIDRRVSAGRLLGLHRGVYAVGHLRLTQRGHWMAAVLACGSGALLSHRSAAALWDLLPGSGQIEVSCRSNRDGPSRVLVHVVRRLRPALVAGIPVTDLSSTLIDLAGSVDERRLRRAVEAAERQRILDLADLRQLVTNSRGRRVGALTTMLAAYHDLDTRSELERRFLDLCRRDGLPLPQMNVLVAGLEVDALWPAHKLVVELDGFRFHGTRAAFERDRQRDARLQLAGFRVLRFTWRQLETKPREVARTIRVLLGRR